MKQFSVVLCCVALALLACDDGNELDFKDNNFTWDEIEVIYRGARSEYEFACDYEQGSLDSSYYFTGTINGNNVCAFADDPRYNDVSFERGVGVPIEDFPDTAAFALGGRSYVFGIWADGPENSYNPSTSVFTPAFPDATSVLSIVENSLRLANNGSSGDDIEPSELLLASDEVSLLEGFNVQVQFDYASKSKYLKGTQWEDNALVIYLESALGNQEGSRLVLSEITKAETDNVIIYDLTMQLDCKLYWQLSDRDPEYFADLKNGILRTRIVVDK